jgi:class 3 adenylate cyclase/pimeloyl-ACP methyl ester carboxylesterase
LKATTHGDLACWERRREDEPVERPRTRYARSADGTYIAYQVFGDGPIDIAWQFDSFGTIDASWEDPFVKTWWSGLAAFARVILHDRRATGLSSRNVPPPNLETRAADLRIVLDAAGSERPVIGGWHEGLTPAILLAASDPDRVRALVWDDPQPRIAWAPDYPWGKNADQQERELRSLEHWGTIEYGREWAAQFEEETGVAPPDDMIQAMGSASGKTCTPDVAIELTRIWFETDIRSVLPSVQVPTMLMADGGAAQEQGVAEYVASIMPRAELAILPSWSEWRSGGHRAQARPRLEAIRRFIGVDPPRAELDAFLSSVLFTDIVASTERQASLGDHAWKELVEHHHDIVRDALDRWLGIENDNSGDGFFATFDGPARAIRCALEVGERVRDLGIQIRAGVHTGECERIDGKVGGLAVTIGARVAGLASPSEVLASQTVKDLTAGSGLTFQDAGEHELKGVPDRWRLYRVLSGPA